MSVLRLALLAPPASLGIRDGEWTYTHPLRQELRKRWD